MRTLRLLPVLALLALGACDELTPPESARLSTTEVAGLSETMVDEDFLVTSDTASVSATPADTNAAFSISADPFTVSSEFSRTLRCPAGGQIVIEGTHELEWDFATGTGTSDLSLIKTHDACAYLVDTVTITLDGAPNVALQAHHAWENHLRVGLQTLTLDGAVDWSTDDGRAGTCEIDIGVTFDPDAATRTITGTFCSLPIDFTRPWYVRGGPGQGGQGPGGQGAGPGGMGWGGGGAGSGSGNGPGGHG